jgi:hypothetical protein
LLRALARLFRDACFHCIPSSVVSNKLAQLKSCVMCPEVFFSCSPPFQNRRRLSLSAQHSSFCQAVGMLEFLLAKNGFFCVRFSQLLTLSERKGSSPCVPPGCPHSTHLRHRRRLHSCPLSGWIQRFGVHHQRQGTAVQILFVGKPLFSPLHLTEPHYCLPSIL